MANLTKTFGLFFVLVAIFLFGRPAEAQYGGGSGEPNDPYLIYTAEQMNEIGLHEEDWDKHFKLMADIDLGSIDPGDLNLVGFRHRPVDGGRIGTQEGHFSGVFDGSGHVIRNFAYTGEGCVGLFPCLDGKDAEVRNLTLIAPEVRGDSGVGALIGKLEEGTISHCCVEGGSISGNEWVGGLVGYNDGTINNCYAEGANVAGHDCVGGLVGKNWVDSTITNCYSTGSVTGNEKVGGLLGEKHATVTNCYAAAIVSGINDVGGLVGWHCCGTTSDCYAMGTVVGDKCVGGLVGGSSGWWRGTIFNCYSAANVAGTTDVGGLVGFNGCPITNCYAFGDVTGTGWNVGGLVGNNSGTTTKCYSVGSVTGTQYVGGLVGYNGEWGTTSNSFWDIETSGQSTSSGGTGKTTAQMQTASTFVGWGCEPVWMIDEGANYPKLAWENKPGDALAALSEFLAGSGTKSDPYLIYTAEELNTIGLFLCEWSKHFKLMADIDLAGYTGKDFNIIGTRWDNAFTGVFDGNGHKISNFNYSSTDTDYIGLFGYVEGEDAEIKDLGLIDPNVDAGTGEGIGSLVGWLEDGTITGCYVQGGSVTGQYRVGGLVGMNNGGTITNCSAAGIVSGDRYVASLVGFNDDTIINCSAAGIVSGDRYVAGLVGANEGIITSCYATSSVSGMTAIGGLVGYNRDTITNCYAKGDSVTGYSYVGGLVGYNRETITNCYATGIVTGDRYVGGFVGDNLVGRVTDSFWDIEASGQILGVGLGSDDGISGKNMAEMQTLSTFTDAGWDFVGESVNGTEDFWCICEGVDYPRLMCEFVIGDFDGDYDTDFVDFSLFAGRWLGTDSNFFCGDGGTDLTNDGKVDFNDLKKFADNWLAGVSN